MPNQFPIKCSSCKKICPEGSKLKRCTKCYKVGYCDQQCQKDHWTAHKGSCRQTPEPVGTPFIISIPESRATFSKLCQLMESYARYSVDVFQPPMKVEPAPKLTSRLSSSNLSNSSQSSGSQNSLDSQSSFSSSCTITAEQEQSLEDTDLPDCDIVSKDGSQSFSGDSAGLSQTGSSLGQTDSGISFQTGSGDSFKPMILKAQKDNLNETARSDSGYSSVTDLPTRDPVGSSLSELERGQDKEFTSPVKPVLGIQTGDLERSTPMFFIKPVDADGNGLTGAYGDRLEDKGDIPLDLSESHFLSVDWKNNDKFKGYVLVQSKDLDFDNDVSMMTATTEENNVTLEQCLELFTEPEKLKPEEAWYCPQCKEHREATKQLSTWKLPHTLIIQLKRFSFRNFIWRDKIDKMVEFPTRGLDLSAYYIGSRPSNEPPPIYDLYGVVNHHGGILGGHYTSHVRCAEISANVKSEVGWRLCDDSRVSAVSHEKNVVTRAAYLLFYRRRQVFVPPLPAEISAQSNEMSEQSTGQNKQVDQMSEISNKFSEQRDNKTELSEKSEKIYKKSAKMSKHLEEISEHSNKTNEEEDEVYESACSDIEETSRSDTVENTERLVIDFTRNEEADRSGDESGGGGSDKVVGEPTGAGLDDNEEVEELGYTDMDSVD